MIKCYKYRIYPTNNQKIFFDKSFGCCRYIYNWALDLRIKSYNQNKKYLSYFTLCNHLTSLKKDKIWLCDPSTDSLRQSIKSLDCSFKHFFNKYNDFPKFKSKHYNLLSCKFNRYVYFDFDKKRIRVPKCGWIKFSCDRKFEGKIGTLTITKTNTLKYYASIVVENGELIPNKPKIYPNTTVGIDVGIKSFAVLSDGRIFDNPKFFENNQQRLKILQRRLSRKQNGSKKRYLARLKVANKHERITNLRKNYIHQTTSKIIAENQSIIIEDLNINGMLKNHCLAKSISSVAWGEFYRQLHYKSEWYGRNLIKIGRFEPSSKMCTCGLINNKLNLSQRTWTCSCGLTHDRDFLAAINIKKIGLEKYSPVVNGEGDVELSTLVGA